jgi:hypothetical protein
MEPIRNAEELALYWVQPRAMARSFSLHSDEREFARLDFQSAFGSRTIAETAAQRWSFKRVGFFNPRVTVRRPDDETDLGVYQPRWTGTEGLLTMAGGRTFHWKATNFWATRFAFLDSSGETLLEFKEGTQEGHFSDLFKTQALVHISKSGWELAEIDLLAALGWYLLILYHEDAAGAAAAVVATS